MANEQGR